MRSLVVACVAACVLAGCRQVVYTDASTHYTVRANQRYDRGVGISFFGVIPTDGDRGEPGDINPAVIEYIFGAPEGPYARYYDLVLALADKPADVVADLQALEVEARRLTSPGAVLHGADYARALARKLAGSINEALGRGWLFEGTAALYWGIPVDLDAGIPLLDYERDGEQQMWCTLYRYKSVGVILMRSSATQQLFAWDVSTLPGAFDGAMHLDPATVATHVIALHGGER